MQTVSCLSYSLYSNVRTFTFIRDAIELCEFHTHTHTEVHMSVHAYDS